MRIKRNDRQRNKGGRRYYQAQWILIATFYLCLPGPDATAQILDDSTKLVYGPTTTQYTTDEQIKYNDIHFQPIDTSIIDIHRVSHTEESEQNYQNLGVIGTAVRSMYYKPPTIIGVRSGFEVYDPYFRPVSDFRYYDTKSPYSRIGAAVGGRGRARVDVGFNRSDSSNFNIGIDYRRRVADKQTSSIGRNDRLTDSEGYDAYLVYHTRNNKYLIMGNFSRVLQKVADQGGVDTTGSYLNINAPPAYFDENANVFLDNASSSFKKRNIHLYHQFQVAEPLQIFQTFDRTFEENTFKIDNMGEKEDAYFDRFYYSTDTTLDVNTFTTTRLKTGVKGTLGKFFYQGYYQLRDYEFKYSWAGLDTLGFDSLAIQTEGLEHYLGGHVRIALNEKYQLKGYLEFNLNGNQRLGGDLLANDFDAHLVIQQYEPTFMQKAYQGNHDFWINNFDRTSVLHVEGGYKVRLKQSSLRPKVQFSVVSNHVYYDTLARPQQVDGSTTILIPGLSYNLRMAKHFYLTGEANYSIVSGKTTEAFPMPPLKIHANIYYTNLFFNGNLQVQGGIDAHWMSDYYAPDYRVSTNQFHIQNYFNVPSYPLLDVYMNIKLDHAYVFAKWNNPLYLINQEGYFTAPNYIGKRALFDFGFYWLFFD